MGDLADRIYELTLGQKLREGKKKVPVNDALAPDLADRMAATESAVATPESTPAAGLMPAIAADREARKEAAAAAAANPMEAMKNATVVAPGIEPKLIPIGTPSPAVSPTEIIADREARREAMEAARAQLAAGAAPTVVPPATPVPEVAAETVEVPPIASQAPVETGAAPNIMDLEQPDQRMAQQQQQSALNQATAVVADQIKKEPKIGEKLLKLSQMTGKGILELIQGFAIGMSGSNLPLASEIRRQEKAAKDEQEANAAQIDAQRTFQETQAQAERDFQMTLARLQDDWQNRRFSATSEEEKQAADDKQAFDAAEAQKDRDLRLREAQIASGARSAATAQSDRGDLDKIIQNIVTQLRGQ